MRTRRSWKNQDKLYRDIGRDLKRTATQAQNADALRVALRAFVVTIDATGGVRTDPDGHYAPEGCPDWIDLGEAYALACKALGAGLKVTPCHEE